MPKFPAAGALLITAALALAACSSAVSHRSTSDAGGRARAVTVATTREDGQHPAARTRTTTAKLRAFVLHGKAVGRSRYARSASQPGVRLRRNHFGDLTFETPSGNTSCELRPAAAGLAAESQCWVQQLEHRKARPASCAYEWVPGLVSLTGHAVRVGSCRGDEPFNRYATVLPYGRTLVDRRVGAACRSDARYVACVSLHGRGGFLADRDAITPVTR